MSVENQMSVDGIGKSKETDELVLLIADEIDWSNEKAHLEKLQSKINAYAMFITSKQYTSIYPNEKFNDFLIQIMFVHEPTTKAKTFIAAAGNYLRESNIRIISETV